MTTFTARTLAYSVTALLGTAAGECLLVYYALRHWFDPWTPALLFVGVVLLPVAVLHTIGAVLWDDSDRSLLEVLRPAMIPVLAAGVLGQIVACAWSRPEVRVELFERAKRHGWPLDYTRALHDPSEGIVTDACIEIFEREMSIAHGRLLGLLDRRPGIAWTCLTSTLSKARSKKFAGIAVDRWYRELMHAEAGRGRACELARYMATFPNRKQYALPGLVDCALSAPTERATACCTDALVSTDLVGERLADALARSNVSAFESLPATLVRAAFHQFQMNASQKKRAETLKITGRAMRQFALSSACETLALAPEAERLQSELSATVEESSCASTFESVEASEGMWHRICRRIAPTASDANPSPRDRLCRAVGGELETTVVRRARDVVHSAISGTKRKKFAGEIAEGNAIQAKGSAAMRALRRRNRRKESGKDHYRKIQKDLEKIRKEYKENERFRRAVGERGSNFEEAHEALEKDAPEWASKDESEGENKENSTSSEGSTGSSDRAGESSSGGGASGSSDGPGKTITFGEGSSR